MKPEVRGDYILFWNDRGELDAINNHVIGSLVPKDEWEHLEIDLTSPSAIALSLESAKASVIEQIYDFARYYYENLTTRYAATEVATWARKQQEATDYFNGTLPPESNLATEATERYPEIKLEDAIALLAQSVIAKAEQLNFQSNRIAGVRGRHCDAIAVLDSVEDVLAYDWQSGWT